MLVSTGVVGQSTAARLCIYIIMVGSLTIFREEKKKLFLVWLTVPSGQLHLLSSCMATLDRRHTPSAQLQEFYPAELPEGGVGNQTQGCSGESLP
jgi:hypothetical protein